MKSNENSELDEPIIIDLDEIRAKSNGSSLTLREYKELSTKDRSTLTKREKEQLSEAHKQLAKVAESVSKHYDTTEIMKAVQGIYKSPAFQSVQAIDLSPLVKAVTDTQKTLSSIQPTLDRAFGIQEAITPAIEAIYKSSLFTQNQFAALAATQKLLASYPTESILSATKRIQDIFLAPFIARTMFADFHTAHERILRNLRFDIGSLTANIEFSRSEIVDIDLSDVSLEGSDLTATTTATQTSSTGNLAFTESASLVLAFNDLKKEVYDLREQLLNKGASQGKLLLEPSAVHFQRTASVIQIGSYRVEVSISSKQTQFARILVSNPTKRWDIEDLIFEALGERIDKDERDWIKKIRSYLHQLNNKVLRHTNNTMPNFFVLDGIEVYVNPEYLNL